MLNIYIRVDSASSLTNEYKIGAFFTLSVLLYNLTKSRSYNTHIFTSHHRFDILHSIEINYQ